MVSFNCTPAWVFVVTVLLSMCVYTCIIVTDSGSTPSGCVMCMWSSCAIIVFLMISSICVVSSMLAWLVGGLIILSACCVLCGQVTGLLTL